MDERDLIRDTKMALDDLAGLAPDAPSLESITSGYARLRRESTPPTWWRAAAILAGAAVVTLVVLGIAALIGSNVGDSDGVAGPGVATTTSEEPVQGIWVLSTYTYNGTPQTVDEARLTASAQTPAWIEISSDGVMGYTGCNTFESAVAPNQDGDILVFGEIIVTAAGCEGETPEAALLEALWSGSEGVAVTINSDTMTWANTTVELTFERRDRRPLAQPGEWPSGVGRLDCSPGVSLTQILPDSGQSLTDTLRSIPGVMRVEEGGPFSWGIDDTGTVIAGAAYGDVAPRVVQLDACASSFGVRAEADLDSATFTWANNLGLAQTSPFVWGPRFVALCSPDVRDLSTLAQRYLDEDAATSIRGDGSTPSLDQAARTLETIQRSTCAAAPSSSTTTPSPTSTTIPVTTGIGNQPEITNDVVSPSWVTVDDEDPGGILQTVLDGGEMPQLSDTIVATVLENLPANGWTPYLYRATMAGDVPMREDVDVYLGNEDALSVTWYYRWDNTPGCDICDTNAVPWDNGWMVWTDADPARGVILYYATNPDLPLNARIVFFPDPIEWPEATAEDKPVLRTQPGKAAALATSILDSLADTIPMPDRATP